jgi:ribonucleoside-triphosphate reductase
MLNKRGGGLFGANPLTGSIGVVTINMARIGYQAKSEEDFFARLGKLMDLAKESLVIKRKTVERLTDQGLYPYSSFYLRGIKEQTGAYWTNHFSTIGLLGMNEALLNFMNKSITTKEGSDFTIKVLDFMRDKLQKYQDETGDIFNLEATPGEGTSRRFAWADKKQFPEIIVANDKQVKEHGVAPYYTNSTQIPVTSNLDLFSALDLQDPLQTRYTGGTVFHVFLGERLPSKEATKNLVRKISANYKMPYFSLTPTFSICPIHGYLKGEHEYCPVCAREN